jgi:uncharacterized protein YjiS (DUF1127 family)
MAVTDHSGMIRNPSLTRTAPVLALGRMFTLWRTRRQLRALDATQLSDIGITADAAYAEANRPVWDVPTNWRD